MSNSDDNRQMFARLRNSEVSRNFHRLGLLVAAIIIVTGLLLMTKDALGLRLWDLIPADIPILAGGIAIGLTGIGLVSWPHTASFVQLVGRLISLSKVIASEHERRSIDYHLFRTLV